MGLIYDLVFGLFLPILLCIGVGFYLYRRKKMRVPQAKATINKRDELGPSRRAS